MCNVPCAMRAMRVQSAMCNVQCEPCMCNVQCETNQGDEFLNLNPPNSSTEPPSDNQPVNIETPDSSASGNTELRYPQRHRQPPNRLDPHF